MRSNVPHDWHSGMGLCRWRVGLAAGFAVLGGSKPAAGQAEAVAEDGGRSLHAAWQEDNYLFGQ